MKTTLLLASLCLTMRATTVSAEIVMCPTGTLFVATGDNIQCATPDVALSGPGHVIGAALSLLPDGACPVEGDVVDGGHQKLLCVKRLDANIVVACKTGTVTGHTTPPQADIVAAYRAKCSQ